MNATIIALFGRRQVGKSHIADHLVEHHDFIRLHPFNPGKAGLRAVYTAVGATEEQAARMTDTDLKDVPMGYLPKKDLSTPNRMQDETFFAKTFAEGYLRYIGIPKSDVKKMVHGDERYAPDNRLPGNAMPDVLISCIEDFARDSLWDEHQKGDFRSPKTKLNDEHPEGIRGHYTSRHVMEKIGQLLGVGLGADWTLNAEIKRSKQIDGDEHGKVIESIVYEAPELQKTPGVVLVRVSSDREIPIESPDSDAFIQTIREDAKFHNPMNGIEMLGDDFDEAMFGQGVVYDRQESEQEMTEPSL